MHMNKPRLKRTIARLEAPDGNLILLRTGRPDVCIQHPDVEERGLVAALDGEHSSEDLMRRFGTARVEEALDELGGLGLLEDAAEDDLLAPEVRERFEGQLRYFADVTAADGPTAVECQRRLAEARVAILGVGGLGGRVALDLASVGIGELRLADGDRVEASNLNRQIQFDAGDVGLSKVERTAARIGALNVAGTVRTREAFLTSEEEIGEFVAGADIVVDAADWPPHEIERRCNVVCFDLGIPYIAMSHFPPIARFGPLYVPGETGCYACQEAAIRQRYPLYDAMVEQGLENPSPVPTFGPACGLTAGMVAMDVLNHLTGLMRPLTHGAGYTFDLRTCELRRHEVPGDPECPVCGRAAPAEMAA